jgi:hypothetical protein
MGVVSICNRPTLCLLFLPQRVGEQHRARGAAAAALRLAIGLVDVYGSVRASTYLNLQLKQMHKSP